MKKLAPAFVLTVSLFCSCGNANNSQPDTTANPAPPTINYTIVKAYPHDTTSYTEGLFWLNNKLYESTGNYGESELREEDLTTGKADKVVKLDKQYFGEGISIINNKLYQLTYKEQKVFVYDPVTFKKMNEMEWTTGQGWGMTHNETDLIISTGSANLYFVDPETFKIKHTVTVTDEYGPVNSVNELEYVNGVIYSNIYQSDTIIKIDPGTGRVLGRMDMKGLLEKAGAIYPTDFDPADDVLNGIAYDAAKNSFYITGKHWPYLFEIKLQ